ncbi:hypothetical protein D7D52_23190 [Nocardia yunnanensis]|uniref:DUF2550 family protein n=1 Tax=Nocardia yunnanensis TaxID=2382165 RepID=A0A386ZFH3_9NOCA|nr:hypothetical protein D7D52_23190 [Nocardia yunnanensis]
MPWDAWALLLIIALCLTVIAVTARDSYRLSRESRRDTLRLPLATGGYLDIPSPPTHPVGRHRLRP